MRCDLLALGAAGLLLATAAACADDPTPQGSDRPGPVAESELGPGLAPAGRPELRFTPPFGWMNDPNGLARVDDRWHLFFQYNPYSIEFGNIGWGHAVSDDLRTWESWPVAIEPTADELIFSGSLVTGGSPACDAASGEGECMIAVYTTNRIGPGGVIQTQDLAASRDGGRTFAKFGGNPVIDLAAADFRDPKVFFHAGTERWIMVVVLPIERQVVLFGSSDLVSWEELSRFGPLGSEEGIWECPDLFPAPVVDGAGDAIGERWVMKVDTNPGHPAGGSGAQWYVGEFDGVEFRPDADQPLPRWLDHGRDFYCATTFHGGADELGRPVWLGWMNNWTYAGELPTFPWRGSMTLPRRLELRPVEGGVELVQEIELGGAPAEPWAGEGLPPGAFRVDLDVELDGAPSDRAGRPVVELRAAGTPVAHVVWNDVGDAVVLERTAAGNDSPESFPGRSLPLVLGDDGVSMVVDANGIELWRADGTGWITSLLVPIAALDELVVGDGVEVEVTDLR